MKQTIYILSILFFSSNIYTQNCFDADPSIWVNPWQSCQVSENPNPERPEGHWLLYDLGMERDLSSSWIWNCNDPSKLNRGFKNVVIDYSSDGMSWTNWGSMLFPKADGEAIYGGFPGPNLVEVKARYVLLSAVDNYGDPCFSLSEVKFNLLLGGEGIEINEEEDEDDDEEIVCVEVDEVIVEEVYETEAFVFWEYDFEEDEGLLFYFKIREKGDDEWMIIETVEPEIFLEDLTPSTEYEVQIAVECEDDFLES